MPLQPISGRLTRTMLPSAFICGDDLSILCSLNLDSTQIYTDETVPPLAHSTAFSGSFETAEFTEGFFFPPDADDNGSLCAPCERRPV
jgi:hypothetical protein